MQRPGAFNRTVMVYIKCKLYTGVGWYSGDIIVINLSTHDIAIAKAWNAFAPKMCFINSLWKLQ